MFDMYINNSLFISLNVVIIGLFTILDIAPFNPVLFLDNNDVFQTLKRDVGKSRFLISGSTEDENQKKDDNESKNSITGESKRFFLRMF